MLNVRETKPGILGGVFLLFLFSSCLFACGLKTHILVTVNVNICTGDRQSVPKLPGFRWLYHQGGKQLRWVLPVLTSMKSWATAACESTLTLYYLSPIPPVALQVPFFDFQIQTNAFRLNASTTAMVFSCFLHQLLSRIQNHITPLF